jgi:hypothetical protein
MIPGCVCNGDYAFCRCSKNSVNHILLKLAAGEEM